MWAKMTLMYRLAKADKSGCARLGMAMREKLVPAAALPGAYRNFGPAHLPALPEKRGRGAVILLHRLCTSQNRLPQDAGFLIMGALR